MRKCIAVYERKGKLLFRSSSKMPNGMWADVGECTVLSVGAAPADVGEVTRAHLAASGTLAPKPQGDMEPVLRAAGVKSSTTFTNGSKNVSVAAEGDVIAVTPTDRRGAVYWPANAEVIRIPMDSDAKTLGETVLRALANSS
jgi:hypothetical protein